MVQKKILLVDDEIDIVEFVSMYLQKEKFKVLSAYNGHDALKLVIDENPDLIVLDILLPDMNGLELCKEIRKTSISPIIFLSCKNEESDKIIGLDVGGDDYITKPFSPRELMARIKANLRRNELLNIKTPNKKILHYNDLKIYVEKHEVLINSNQVKLSAKEFDLLLLLAQNPGQVFSMEQLFDKVWKLNNIGDTRTIMVHISNIRKKIETNPSNPEYLLTIKGAGYKFNNVYKEKRNS